MVEENRRCGGIVEDEERCGEKCVERVVRRVVEIWWKNGGG